MKSSTTNPKQNITFMLFAFDRIIKLVCVYLHLACFVDLFKPDTNIPLNVFSISENIPDSNQRIDAFVYTLQNRRK